MARSIIELDTAATSRHLIHLMDTLHHPGRTLSFWLRLPRDPGMLPFSFCVPLNSANLIMIICAPDRDEMEEALCTNWVWKTDFLRWPGKVPRLSGQQIQI